MDEHYKEQNQTWHVEDSAWKAEQVIKLIQKNDIEGRSYCEVGCGAGEILVQLDQNLDPQAQYTGYDISPQLDDFWSDRRSDNIRFVQEDFFQTDGFYDIILCLDVVEHVDNYIEFLEKIRDRGRYKIFNFPLEIFALKAFLGHRYVDSIEKYGHIHYFNKDICLTLLKKHGYNVLDYFYAPGAIELADTTTSITFASKLLKYPRWFLSLLSKDVAAKILGGFSLFILAE